MAKTIIINSGTASSTSTTLFFQPLGGGFDFNYGGESGVETIFRTAGTLSDLQVAISANSTTANSTVKTRKNTLDGGQTATILSGQTGLFEAPSGTDTIAAGDRACYTIGLGSAHNLTFEAISVCFAATTNTVTKLIAGPSQAFTSNATYYYSITSFIHVAQTSELPTRVNMRKAGTFKNLATSVSSANSTIHTVNLRKNGANVIAIAIPASQTGWFENTSDTSSCAVDDDYNYQVVHGTSSTIANIITCEFETTDNSGLIVSAYPTGRTYLKITTNYIPIGGSPSVGITTESFTQTESKEAFTFSNLQCYISAFTAGSGTNSLTLRKGAAGTALTLNLNSTGLKQDTANTVTATATDLLDYQIVNGDASGGANNITITWIAMFYTSGEAPPAAPAALPAPQSHGNIHQAFDNRQENVINTIFGPPLAEWLNPFRRLKSIFMKLVTL